MGPAWIQFSWVLRLEPLIIDLLLGPKYLGFDVDPILSSSVSGLKSNGTYFRTQFSWVRLQDPRVIGRASRPNSLGFGIRTQG